MKLYEALFESFASFVTKLSPSGLVDRLARLESEVQDSNLVEDIRK